MITVVNTGEVNQYIISIEVQNSNGSVIAKGNFNHGTNQCSNMSHSKEITLDQRYDIELDIEKGRVAIF